MTTRPTTAVILAAGRGSRRLPVTRAVEKAMLPIGNRPVVDYVVEQCAEAGMQRIVFVVAAQDSLIQRYYGHQVDVQQEYPWLSSRENITLEYIVQPEGGKYGTAAALSCVELAVSDECFVVMPADGFIHGYGQSVVSRLADAIEGGEGALAGLNVTAEEAKRHSLIEKSNGALTGLIEKPTEVDMTKEYEVNISYYLLPRRIFSHIAKLEPVNGEYRLTDAVVSLAPDQKIAVVPTVGAYMDSGELSSWIAANVMLFKP